MEAAYNVTEHRILLGLPYGPGTLHPGSQGPYNIHSWTLGSRSHMKFETQEDLHVVPEALIYDVFASNMHQG